MRETIRQQPTSIRDGSASLAPAMHPATARPLLRAAVGLHHPRHGVMRPCRRNFYTIENSAARLRWATIILLEVGAIRECEEHGWIRDRSDSHARERAVLIARHEPPRGISPERAVAAVRDVLESIGDTCPECPPE